MRIPFVQLFVSALLVISVALAQGEAGRVIRDLADGWQELHNQRDFAGVADLYTEDAIFYGIDGSVEEGRDAIRASLPLPLPPGEGDIEVTTDEAEVFGDWGYGTGSNVFTAPDGSTMLQGHFVTINRLDGEWKVHRQIASMLLPEPAEP
jgi:uncharacterized protein (TIGR02246 family)